MITPQPDAFNLLNRIEVLDEKIKYAEKQYHTASSEGKAEFFIKTLQHRLNSLKKEKSLFHQPMQKLKPFATYRSYLYNKIENMSEYNSSGF